MSYVCPIHADKYVCAICTYVEYRGGMLIPECPSHGVMYKEDEPDKTNPLTK